MALTNKDKRFDLRYGTLFKKLKVGYRQEEQEIRTNTIVCVEYEDGQWFCDCGPEEDIESEKKARLLVKWANGKLGKK